MSQRTLDAILDALGEPPDGPEPRIPDHAATEAGG